MITSPTDAARILAGHRWPTIAYRIDSRDPRAHHWVAQEPHCLDCGAGQGSVLAEQITCTTVPPPAQLGPFTIVSDPTMPRDRIDFVDSQDRIVGRIANIRGRS